MKGNVSLCSSLAVTPLMLPAQKYHNQTNTPSPEIQHNAKEIKLHSVLFE
jgi:hypothetical protein